MKFVEKVFFFFLVTYVRTIKKALKQTWRHRPIINGLSNKSRSRLFKKSIKGYYILHRVYLINDACVKLLHAKCDFFFFFHQVRKNPPSLSNQFLKTFYNVYDNY